MLKPVLAFLLFLLLHLTGWAQTDSSQTSIKRIGIPFMVTYGLSDYSSKTATYGAQNYDVLVGDDQKIYFANIEGVLVFDGVNWTRLRLPGRAATYSLSKASDGTIYVGGLNEIGYLSNSTNGTLEYHSLMPEFRKISDDNFTGFFNFMLHDEVVFSDSKLIVIFNYKTGEMQVVKKPDQVSPIQRSYQDALYTYHGDSLYRLDGSGWEAVRLSKLSKSSDGNNVLPIDIGKNETIVITNNGFFDFETEEKLNIDQSVSKFLAEAKLINVNLLADKYLSISTNKGLLITDVRGNPFQFLNEQKGLSNNLVFNTTLDSTGLLWVAANLGITKVEISSPFSLFDKRAGLTGNVSFIQQEQDDLFLATAAGTLRQKWNQLLNPLEPYTFQKLSDEESRFLIQGNKEIISLSVGGPQVIQNEEVRSLSDAPADYYWTGFRYRDSDDLLIGSRKGQMLHLSKKGGKWVINKELPTSFPDILFMAEGENNQIWITHRNGVFKMEYNREQALLMSTKSYGQSDGLPFPTDNYVFDIGSKPCFSTFNGIYRYDAATDKFVKDERFIESLGDQPVLRIAEDAAGNIYCLGDGILILKKTNKGYQLQRILNEKIANYNPFNITALDTANILLPTFGAFVHLDPTIPLHMDSFKTTITGIGSLGHSDTLYYGGFGVPKENLAVSFKDNALRISFAAAFYQNIDRIEYKWRIKELDQVWSDWSQETKKDYTNLPHGSFTFEVVARNVHFVESDPATIQFTVFPPWYFTWWAYVFYLGLFVLFIWAIVKIYTRKIRADRTRLEAIVTDRTREINEQMILAEGNAETISLQRDKLVKMDELKSHFFLNISHELRTPLTLVMGTVERALNGSYGDLDSRLKENLNVSANNSRRLFKMVNNILDISKLESGGVQIKASPLLVSGRLSKVADFFSSKFHNKNITLSVDLRSNSLLYVDVEKFETIFINLIGNAFKFTPSGGVIAISAEEDEHWVHLSVSDNGTGIPSESLPFVFDRFYQNPDQINDQGTGLGLALCKELVELHQGKIQVASEYGKGSTFTVSFQKGKDHLDPDKIVEVPTAEVPINDMILPEEKATLPAFQRNESEEAPHILVVEDNSEMSRFIAEILSDDYHVSVVENGRKGLEFLEEIKPDLILTDYLMPEMDGFEMASEIKKTQRLAFIPMIFLTARAEEEDRVNVLNLGVDDFLAKPFNSTELLARIKNLLATKAHRDEFIEELEIDSSEIAWTEFNSKLRDNLDAYIKQNIEKEISGEDLANNTGHSERSLYRKVKANTGLSLMQYVREYRLRQARTLLESKEMSTVSEVAYAVGFNYLSHFTKNFKERFGKTPSEYLD